MRFPSTIHSAMIVFAVLAVSYAHGQDSAPQAEALQEEIARLQAQVEALSEAVTAPTLLIANTYLDAAGFHAMDEALHAGELDPRYLETVRITLMAINAFAWPEELREEATAFIGTARELEAALQEEEIEVAADAAAQAHERQHDLAQAIFAYLSPDDASGAPATPEEDAGASEIPEGALHFVLDIGENGGAVGGADTYRVRRGDIVALTLSSATPGGLHLHGFDHEWELEGEQITTSFPAEVTGRFPLEFHPTGTERGVVVGYLEVRP